MIPLPAPHDRITLEASEDAECRARQSILTTIGSIEVLLDLQWARMQRRQGLSGNMLRLNT